MANGMNPRRAKDVFLLGAFLVYFVTMLIAAADIVPLRTGIAEYLLQANGGAADAVANALRQLPYLQRVDSAMRAVGASESDVASKIDYLTSVYFVLMVGYIGMLLVVASVQLVWGAHGDFTGRQQSRSAERGLRLVWVLLIPLGALNLLFLWFGLHGFGDLPEEDPTFPFDYIISSNGYIVINIFFVSISFLTSNLILKILINYIYLRTRLRDAR